MVADASSLVPDTLPKPKGLMPGAPKPLETDPSKIVGSITSQDSPLMRSARTNGLQTANRRGLLNSSMAVGAAERAALDVAAPMASQVANQNAALRSQEVGFENDQSLQDDRIVADRQTQIASQTGSYNSLYQNTVANINANDKLSADARSAQLQAAKTTLQSQIKLVEKLYSIKIDWGV